MQMFYNFFTNSPGMLKASSYKYANAFT